MKFSYVFKNVLGTSFRGANVAFSSTNLYSATGNRVSYYDLESQTSSTLPFETRSNISRLCCSSDGRVLYVADADGYVVVVDVLKKLVLHRFKTSPLCDMVLSHNGHVLCVACEDGKVQLWRAAPLKKTFSPMTLLRTLSHAKSRVTSASFSPNDSFLLLGCSDSTCRLIDVGSYVGEKRPRHNNNSSEPTAPKELKRAVVFAGHNSEIVKVRFLGETTVATVSSSGALHVWRAVSCSDDENDDVASRLTSVRLVEWENKGKLVLHQRAHSTLSSVDLATTASNVGLVACGFENGCFSLFNVSKNLSDASFQLVHLQTLSMSSDAVTSVSLNGPTNDWIALGVHGAGALSVWEWESETFVVKQQGHAYGINDVSFSADGRMLATGGDDGKVKLWSTTTGFCFVTFSDHDAGVTAVEFLKSKASAVLSASLDGTVKAFDLVRYRNFRTLETSKQGEESEQLTCLATDGDGDVVYAGAVSGRVYLWQLSNSNLLEVISSHEQPVSSLKFIHSSSTLVTSSWDATIRFFEPYSSTTPVETLEMKSDVLCVDVSPDHGTLVASTLGGTLIFYDLAKSEITEQIDVRRDARGGRLKSTKAESNSNYFFSSACFNADGTAVVCGGNANFVCVYSCLTKKLVKKYRVSKNRSLDGTTDVLRSSDFDSSFGAALGEARGKIQIDEFDAASGKHFRKVGTTPGATRGSEANRSTLESISTSRALFSPTGSEFAIATTQGVMIYGLDEALVFDPRLATENVDKSTVSSHLANRQWSAAIVGALHLNETDVISSVIRKTPVGDVDAAVRGLPAAYATALARSLARELEGTAYFEFILHWVVALLSNTSTTETLTISAANERREALRALSSILDDFREKTLPLGSENAASLRFLLRQE